MCGDLCLLGLWVFPSLVCIGVVSILTVDFSVSCGLAFVCTLTVETFWIFGFCSTSVSETAIKLAKPGLLLVLCLLLDPVQT